MALIVILIEKVALSLGQDYFFTDEYVCAGEVIVKRTNVLARKRLLYNKDLYKLCLFAFHTSEQLEQKLVYFATLVVKEEPI